MKKHLHWAGTGHLQLYLGGPRAKGRRLIDELVGVTHDSLGTGFMLGGIRFFYDRQSMVISSGVLRTPADITIGASNHV